MIAGHSPFADAAGEIMCLYVCIYVCVFVYVSISVRMYVCMFVWLAACRPPHMPECLSVYPDHMH
jgi:hypothetical protein